MANIKQEELMQGLSSSEQVVLNAVLLWGVEPNDSNGNPHPHAAKYPKESLKSFETAVAFVKEYGYEYAENVTYAKDSIETAVEGINKNFSLEGTKHSDYSKNKVQCSNADYDKIIEILAGIHDKWVATQAKKYDRDANEEGSRKDRRLIQHMSTELIGLDELLFDLAFVAPYLESMGFNVGEITSESWGNGFKSSPEIKAAYDRYVEKKLSKVLSGETELEEYIDKQINGEYAPLQGTDEKSIARKTYMNERKELLCEKAQSRIPALAALQSNSQPE